MQLRVVHPGLALEDYNKPAARKSIIFCKGRLVTGHYEGLFGQILSYFMMFSLEAIFYIFIGTFCWVKITPALTILAIIFNLFTIYYQLKCSYSDPGIVERGNIDYKEAITILNMTYQKFKQQFTLDLQQDRMSNQPINATPLHNNPSNPTKNEENKQASSPKSLTHKINPGNTDSPSIKLEQKHKSPEQASIRDSSADKLNDQTGNNQRNEVFLQKQNENPGQNLEIENQELHDQKTENPQNAHNLSVQHEYQQLTQKIQDSELPLTLQELFESFSGSNKQKYLNVESFLQKKVFKDIAPIYTERYCYTCKIMKQSKVSHCKLCEQCVKRFDHHCMVIGSCIGERNWAAFVLFLFYGTLFCLIATISSIWVFVVTIQNYDFSFALDFYENKSLFWTLVGIQAAFFVLILTNSQFIKINCLYLIVVVLIIANKKDFDIYKNIYLQGLCILVYGVCLSMIAIQFGFNFANFLNDRTLKEVESQNKVTSPQVSPVSCSELIGRLCKNLFKKQSKSEILL